MLSDAPIDLSTFVMLALASMIPFTSSYGQPVHEGLLSLSQHETQLGQLQYLAVLYRVCVALRGYSRVDAYRDRVLGC